MLLISTVLMLPVTHSCKKSISSCGDIDYSPKYHANKLEGNLEYVNDSILYSDLSISLNFSGQHYSILEKTFDLFSAAYACSPVEPYTEEKITNISITSDVDFDETHPAGSELRDFFEVSPYLSGNVATVSEYLSRQPNVENAQLRLTKAPDEKKKISFTITYNFEGKLLQKLVYQTPAISVLTE